MEEEQLITVNVMEVACELAHARVFDEYRDVLDDNEFNMYQTTVDDDGIETLVYKDFIQDGFNTWYGWYEDNLNALKI